MLYHRTQQRVSGLGGWGDISCLVALKAAPGIEMTKYSLFQLSIFIVPSSEAGFVMLHYILWHLSW